MTDEEFKTEVIRLLKEISSKLDSVTSAIYSTS